MSASSGTPDPNLMRDEEQAAKAPQVNARSSYTPTPIKKQRSVTNMNLKAISDPPSSGADVASAEAAEPQRAHTDAMDAMGMNSHHPAQARSALVAPVQSQETPHRPASIQLNMNTMDVIASSLVETEQQRNSKLAEFEPLSMTMMGEVTPTPSAQSDDAWADDWARGESTAVVEETHHPRELETGLHPFDQAHSSISEPMGDVYRSRRRLIFWMLCVMVMFAWFIGMSMQVGVERLISDPYHETAQAIFGIPKPDSEAERQAPPPPITNVIAAPTPPQLSVERVESLGRARGHRVFAVYINIENPGEAELTAARVKLSLRSAVDTPQAWVKRFEFNCCQDIMIADLSARERRAMLKEVVTGAREQDGQLRLSPGASRSFVYLAPLKSSLKVSGDAPEVELELLFSE